MIKNVSARVVVEIEVEFSQPADPIRNLIKYLIFEITLNSLQLLTLFYPPGGSPTISLYTLSYPFGG